MVKIYVCKEKFTLPLVNDKHRKIKDFVVENTSFWECTGETCDGRIIFETTTEEIRISKEQLKKHFNRI